MKSWLIALLVPIIILLFLVVIQIWQTRHAMAKFANRHGMLYVKNRVPFFGTGEVQGTVNASKFYMGMMSMDYRPEKDERDLSYWKFLSMHIEINGMPWKLIVQTRDSSSHVTETKRNQTVTPLIKTGDADFDSRFSVYGDEKEVLQWLTAGRRHAIATILPRESCAISKGGLIYSTSKTRLKLEEMEQMYAQLTAAQKGFVDLLHSESSR